MNLAAPNPLPQRDFMAALRAACGARIGLPATRWMAEIGAFFLRTDTELTFKSRRVVPGRLLAAGFGFEWPDWPAAARDLVTRWRAESLIGAAVVQKSCRSYAVRSIVLPVGSVASYRRIGRRIFLKVSRAASPIAAPCQHVETLTGSHPRPPIAGE